MFKLDYWRVRDAVLLSLFLSVVYDLVVHALAHTLALRFSPSYAAGFFWEQLINGYPAAMGHGFERGLMWSIPSFLFLSRKRYRSVIKWHFVAFYPIALPATYFFWLFDSVHRDPLVRSLFPWFPTMCFVALCMLLWRYLPEVGVKDRSNLDCCPRCGFDFVPRCQKCGYNLTGNMSGRCPECGNVRSASD
jgi:hypothetical protein